MGGGCCTASSRCPDLTLSQSGCSARPAVSSGTSPRCPRAGASQGPRSCHTGVASIPDPRVCCFKNQETSPTPCPPPKKKSRVGGVVWPEPSCFGGAGWCLSVLQNMSLPTNTGRRYSCVLRPGVAHFACLVTSPLCAVFACGDKGVLMPYFQHNAACNGVLSARRHHLSVV